MRAQNALVVSREADESGSESTSSNAARRPLTVIVRAVPKAILEGQLAGQVEVVDTGERLPIASVENLVEILQQLARSTNED